MVPDTFIQSALDHAQIEFLANDKMFYGEIPGFPGVHATADTPEACRAELESALRDWVAFRLARGRSVPGMHAMERVVHGHA